MVSSSEGEIPIPKSATVMTISFFSEENSTDIFLQSGEYFIALLIRLVKIFQPNFSSMEIKLFFKPSVSISVIWWDLLCER
jgi:hypothetical protein